MHSAPEPPPEPRRLRRRPRRRPRTTSALALYYQRIGDFDNALAHYRALLEQNDASAEVHNNLGLLYEDHGQRDDAVKQFQRAIAIDPKYVKAHNNLGVSLMRANQTAAAAAEFRVALAADPRNVESLVNLALAAEGRRPHRRRARPAAPRAGHRSAQRRLALQPRGRGRRGRRCGDGDRALPGVPALRHGHARRISSAGSARGSPRSAAEVAAGSPHCESRPHGRPECRPEIDDLLREDRTFAPPAEFRAKAVVHDEGIYAEAARDPEAFWARLAGELEWSRPWDTVLDWQPPHAKWFVGGKINASVNCLDRHVRGARRNKAALIWEGEPGDRRTLTYFDLYRQVSHVRQRAEVARRHARAIASRSTCR